MTKVEKLKIERRIINAFTLLPTRTLPMIDNYYEREIENIEKYGGENPIVHEDSLEFMKSILEEVCSNGNQETEQSS